MKKYLSFCIFALISINIFTSISYAAPLKVNTDFIVIDGVKLEYAVVKDKFIFLKRPDLYYYTQNAEQSWLNQITGDVVKSFAVGMGTYVTYLGVDKIPYAARLFDKFNNPKPYNFGDYTKGVGALMLQQNVPFWGNIVSSQVPKAGTKTVLIYISLSGKDYTWTRRVRFEITPDKKVTYTKWTVK